MKLGRPLPGCTVLGRDIDAHNQDVKPVALDPARGSGPHRAAPQTAR